MKPHRLWFCIPPTCLPWPRRWYRLCVTYSVPSVRFLGYRTYAWDSDTAHMLGFWFFHLVLGR